MPTGVLAPRRTSAAVEASWPDDLDDLRTVVTLSRDHPQDVGQRQVIVRLDGGPKIALLFGQSVTAEVAPGQHLLLAHNTLFRKKVPFTIEPGEHLEFVLINSARFWTASMAAILGAAPLFLKVIRRSVR
jgi:hypothetical protein